MTSLVYSTDPPGSAWYRHPQWAGPSCIPHQSRHSLTDRDGGWSDQMITQLRLLLLRRLWAVSSWEKPSSSPAIPIFLYTFLNCISSINFYARICIGSCVFFKSKVGSYDLFSLRNGNTSHLYAEKYPCRRLYVYTAADVIIYHGWLGITVGMSEMCSSEKKHRMLSVPIPSATVSLTPH